MVVQKNTTFRSNGINNMAAIGDFFDWPNSNYFFFKVMDQFSQNFAGIDQQDGRQMDYFDSNIFFSETTGPNLTKLCRNDVWMLHKNTTFRSG